MIGKINIRISAANPQMPLGPFHVFAGSAASFTICDIPLPLGVRKVEGVSVQVKNADGETRGLAAVRVGSAWGVTVPAGFLSRSGTVEKGIVITAAGHDDNGEDVSSWKLGAGDVFIMSDNGTVAPGEVRQDLEWFDEVPENPRNGYVAPVEGVVCVYRNGAWVPLGSQGDVRRADFQDIQELEPGDSSGVIKERFNQMLRTIKGTVVAVAAVVGFAVWGELGPDTIMDDVSGTNTVREVVQAAGIGCDVNSVNGKTGTVELAASDVHALPDTYTPPAAPVQSVNGKTGTVELAASDVHALPDTYTPPAAPVQSVNGKTGTVELAASDVHALPDTYTPPAAPVQSVNSKTGAVQLSAGDVGAWDGRYEVSAALALGYYGRTFIGGTAPYSLTWDSTRKRFLSKWAVGKIPTSDWVAYLSDLDDYVPTSRKVNNKPLTGNITLSASDVGAVAQGTLATVATSGSYNDLLNKPAIPEAVTDQHIKEVAEENRTDHPYLEVRDGGIYVVIPE